MGRLPGSAFAKRLVGTGKLLPWQDAPLSDAFDDTAAAVIRPEVVPFISYPYEWTFGQLKDAALLTLERPGRRPRAGLDAQGRHRLQRPVPGRPAGAHRPPVVPAAGARLAVGRVPAVLRALPGAAGADVPPGCAHGPDAAGPARRHPARPRGVPAAGSNEAAARDSAPTSTCTPDRSAATRATRASRPRSRSRSSRLTALVESLRGTVAGLKWDPPGYRVGRLCRQGPRELRGRLPGRQGGDRPGHARRRRDVAGTAAGPTGRMCWDLGANTGRFSSIAADLGYRVLSFDIDPAAAERHYRALRTAGRTDTTPLVMDLADPSPGLGWAGTERSSLVERADADVILALALVHHLAIGRNVPLAHGHGPVRGPRTPGHRGVGAARRPDGRHPAGIARGRVHATTPPRGSRPRSAPGSRSGHGRPSRAARGCSTTSSRR